LGHQNNYVERLSVDDNAAKKRFNVLTISLNVLHNYFDDSNNLFSDQAKFLDTSAKLFFTCSDC